MTRRSPDSRSEQGSAGLLAVWVAAVVLAATTAAVVWGGAIVARHRAARTADLAALAAAQAAFSAGPMPCAAADRVAGPVGAVVTACRLLSDGSVLVVVELGVPVTLPGLDMPPARARARAGVPP